MNAQVLYRSKNVKEAISAFPKKKWEFFPQIGHKDVK